MIAATINWNDISLLELRALTGFYLFQIELQWKCLGWNSWKWFVQFILHNCGLRVELFRPSFFLIHCCIAIVWVLLFASYFVRYWRYVRFLHELVHAVNLYINRNLRRRLVFLSALNQKWRKHTSFSVNW